MAGEKTGRSKATGVRKQDILGMIGKIMWDHRQIKEFCLSKSNGVLK